MMYSVKEIFKSIQGEGFFSGKEAVFLRFTGLREFSIGKRLLRLYLLQPYDWFLIKNSAEISKNILLSML